MRAGAIEWGAAMRTHHGQTISGDRSVVQEHPGGVLVAVIDGVGHGHEAALAARAGAALLESGARGPVTGLLRLCHERLRGTRGAAISVAAIEPEGRMTWAGVGNVEGIIIRADPEARPRTERLVARGGLIGGSMPAPHATEVGLAEGDVVIMATDGVGEEFASPASVNGAPANETPEALAERLMVRHASGHDDALILVVRYLGGAG